jgi:hypothetical protein
MLTNFIKRIVGAEPRAFDTLPYLYSRAERLYSIARSRVDCVVKVMSLRA